MIFKGELISYDAHSRDGIHNTLQVEKQFLKCDEKPNRAKQEQLYESFSGPPLLT